MTTADHSGQDDSAPWLPLRDAALGLGVSERTLRRWIANADNPSTLTRTGYPALQLERRGSSHRVRLLDNPVVGQTMGDTAGGGRDLADQVSGLSADVQQAQTPADSAGETSRETRRAGTERELDAVAHERDWLRAEVERRGVELAEMRRLLGNAQQQLAGLLAGPAQPTAALSADPAGQASDALAPDHQPAPAAITAAIKRAAREAGLGKKQRRRLVRSLEQQLSGA